MLDTVHTRPDRVDIKALQLPLRETYARLPSAAQITDHARTRCDTVPANQPLYGTVEFGDPNRTRLPIALHEGVGGRSDQPVPGELLCGAVASCLDSTIRVIANMFGVSIRTLEVEVSADVDLRGTLRMDPLVPVAFQSLRVDANIVPEGDVPSAHLDAILAAAEQSCVVLQSLRQSPEITVARR